MTTQSSDSQVGWPGHALLVGSAECLVAVFGFAPDALARNAHGAEVEPVDGEVAEGDGAAGGDSARGIEVIR